jgi:GNAT superfamily N-acetyltransferase
MGAMARTQPVSQRVATLADVDAISALMKRSVAELFPRFYDERQTATAVVHVADLDTVLVEDGTYYVHEADGEIVACGGWSRRNRLHAGAGHAEDDMRLLDPRTEPARVRAMFVRGDWTRRGLGRAILEACERDARAEGFTMLALMATLPGVPLYRAFGFEETGRVMVRAPDGVELEGVTMQRPITAA